MWPHRPPCGRLLRNVVILEMWHFALEFWVDKVYKQFMVFACHVTNMPLPCAFLLMLLYISIPSFLDSPAIFLRASFFLRTQENICFLKCLLAKKAKSNSKCLSDLSSLSVIIDDDLCAFPSLHHEGLELDFSA